MSSGRRDVESAGQANDAVAVRRHLLELPELGAVGRQGGAGSVALYSAIQHEVPIDALARELAVRGAVLAYPRVCGAELELRRVRDPHDLEPGSRGLREPDPGAELVLPTSIDVFCVPGVLFDRRGTRLGRGGGHYDRLLAQARPDALLVGLCYAERWVEQLPADPWDVPMHVVVTNLGAERVA